MGAYYLIVNPVKRQYLNPDRFGEAVKFNGLLRGAHCIEALKLLIADCYRRDESSFPGAWLGDPVILASDDSGKPDPGGISTRTADDPDLNLNTLAHIEFTDISYRALAELCKCSQTATELATLAKEDYGLFIELGATFWQYPLPELEAALDAAVGRPWHKAYNQALAKHRLCNTAPPIDWPL